MFDKRSVARSFDASATAYDAYAELQRKVLAETAALAARHISCGATVLDVGCGTGALAALPETASWKLVGLDIAPRMALSTLKKYGTPSITADMERLPLKNESVEGALASLSLQWVQPAAGALKEIYRVLKPGGVAVISTFGPDTLQELREVLQEADHKKRVHEFESLDELIRQATRAGFHCKTGHAYYKYTEEKNMLALMKSLKNLGASNRREDRPRGLTTHRLFEKAQILYKTRYQTPRGLRATWEILSLVLVKA